MDPTTAPTSDKTTSDGRRFQFSLRTLFVLVAVLGIGLGWVGQQVGIVRERKAMREWIAVRHGYCAPFASVKRVAEGFTRRDERSPPPPYEVSWFRRMLGDRGEILIQIDASRDEIDRIKAIFPEAEIIPYPRTATPH